MRSRNCQHDFPPDRTSMRCPRHQSSDGDGIRRFPPSFVRSRTHSAKERSADTRRNTHVPRIGRVALKTRTRSGLRVSTGPWATAGEGWALVPTNESRVPGSFFRCTCSAMGTIPLRVMGVSGPWRGTPAVIVIIPIAPAVAVKACAISPECIIMWMCSIIFTACRPPIVGRARHPRRCPGA